MGAGGGCVALTYPRCGGVSVGDISHMRVDSGVLGFKKIEGAVPICH